MRGAMLLSIIVLGGCAIIRVDRSIHTRAFEGAPVPRGSVQVYLSGDAIDESCVPVADIRAETEREHLAQLIGRIREEAGRLGANAVQILTMQQPGVLEELAIGILGALDGSPGEGDIDSEAVALHCPSPNEAR